MARHCVYRLAGHHLVLDLQTDFLDLPTRIVAPLVSIAEGPPPLGRLEPIFDISGDRYALHTAEMAAIPARLLEQKPIADLGARADEITRAVDLVFTGF